MPELPEVETIARRIEPDVVGRRIIAFESEACRHAVPSAAEVRAVIVGRTVRALFRRGKLLVFELSEAGRPLWQTVHLRMSGRIEWEVDGRPRHGYTMWRFDQGPALWFCDSRKFGRVTVTTDLEKTMARLGPEPLAPDFTAARLRAMLSGRKRVLKPLLLDQSFLVGLGNIYVDEALFRAGLDPRMNTAALTDQDIGRLHRAIRAVLREGIRYNGTTFDWIYPEGNMQAYLRVYGRKGRPCPRCRAPIARIVVGQRGTHLCLRCQDTDADSVPRRSSPSPDRQSRDQQ